MRNSRSDVVLKALDVLDAYGLADLSMRRLAGELGVRPSALYHHVANKQELLAAVADEILSRSLRPLDPSLGWTDAVRAEAHGLRDAMLAYRDGADLIATVHAFGLGEISPRDRLSGSLAHSGAAPDVLDSAAATLLYFVFGHVADEQTHLQAGSAGALSDDAAPPADAQTFARGLDLIVEGVVSLASVEAASDR